MKSAKQAHYFVALAKRFGLARRQLSYFTDKSARLIEQSGESAMQLEDGWLDAEEIVNGMHYLWLAAALSSFSPMTKSLCCAALRAKMSFALLKHFKLPMVGKLYSPFCKALVLRFVFASCCSTRPQGPAQLPAAPLDQLLDLTGHELSELFDLLGLFELAGELKMVVDKKVYRALFAKLSIYEQQCLAELRAQQERWPRPRLGVGRWLEDVRTLLQMRGLLRFCVAILGLHPNFLWQLTRKLEPKRARLIEQLVQDKTSEAATPLVQEQLRWALSKLARRTRSL